jgi:hypothetical protein
MRAIRGTKAEVADVRGMLGDVMAYIRRPVSDFTASHELHSCSSCGYHTWRAKGRRAMPHRCTDGLRLTVKRS